MQFSRTAAPLLGLATLTVFGFAARPAHADQVDQSQTDGPVFMARFDQTDLAQSFRQTSDNITGASIFLQAGVGVGPGDVTISLYDALPNAGGNLLASGTALGVSDGQVASVDFTQTSLTPNTTYYLAFTDTNLSQGIAGSVDNPYPNGMTFANPGYQPFVSYDYAFQTRSNAADPPAVPEPSQVASMGFGLLGLGGLMLRARRRPRTFFM